MEITSKTYIRLSESDQSYLDHLHVEDSILFTVFLCHHCVVKNAPMLDIKPLWYFLTFTVPCFYYIYIYIYTSCETRFGGNPVVK